jgi:hypothetical protein
MAMCFPLCIFGLFLRRLPRKSQVPLWVNGRAWVHKSLFLVSLSLKMRHLAIGIFAYIGRFAYTLLWASCCCFWVFFLNLSAFALTAWLVMFAVCDQMAAYEEKDLIRIFGEPMWKYTKLVLRWLPRFKPAKYAYALPSQHGMQPILASACTTLHNLNG